MDFSEIVAMRVGGKDLRFRFWVIIAIIVSLTLANHNLYRNSNDNFTLTLPQSKTSPDPNTVLNPNHNRDNNHNCNPNLFPNPTPIPNP